MITFNFHPQLNIYKNKNKDEISNNSYYTKKKQEMKKENRIIYIRCDKNAKTFYINVTSLIILSFYRLEFLIRKYIFCTIKIKVRFSFLFFFFSSVFSIKANLAFSFKIFLFFIFSVKKKTKTKYHRHCRKYR